MINSLTERIKEARGFGDLSENSEYDAAKEGMIKTPVLYPAAVLKNSKNSKEAKEFLEFLKGDECKAIFEKVGFTMAK